eukprot:gene2305-19146_t
MVMWHGPVSSGTPVGRAAGVVSFHINVHYTNDHNVVGAKSQDGITIYYTPDLRPKTVFSAPLMMVSKNPSIIIPPK